MCDLHSLRWPFSCRAHVADAMRAFSLPPTVHPHAHVSIGVIESVHDPTGSASRRRTDRRLPEPALIWPPPFALLPEFLFQRSAASHHRPPITTGQNRRPCAPNGTGSPTANPRRRAQESAETWRASMNCAIVG